MGGRDVLERIALLAIRAPRRIVAIAALVMVACGIFGIPVAKSLSAGGFQDPTSESAQATQLLVDKFGQLLTYFHRPSDSLWKLLLRFTLV